jgi:uncharacterized protein (DUF2336 family)
MSAHLTLITELNDAIAHGTAERRVDVLARVTDLFEFGVAGCADEQIALFDDVFNSLVNSIELSAKATLSERLAKIPNAPPRISCALASDNAIEVARPMLEDSEVLDNTTLVEQARTRSQQHLLAIARRKSLDAEVTDVLVERGDRSVMLKVAENPGATFSELGFMTLVRRSQGDDELTTSVGLRRDIPRHHLLRLLVLASHEVRVRLDAAHLMMPSAVQSAVAEAAGAIQTETGIHSRNYIAACGQIAALKAAGSLDESEVESFAKMGRFEETTAALAAMCELPIESVERAMVQERPETILIIAKAIGFSWQTVKEILKLRVGERGISSREVEECLAIFERLRRATAQQVVDFQRRRMRGEFRDLSSA